MTRNRAEDTRRLLIAIGLRLLHERGPSAAVGHIRLSSVLRRAGLTTGAAYRIWEDQTAYQRDLALEAVRFRDSGSNEGTVAAVIPALLDPAGTWYEAIRLGAEANLRSYPEDVAFLTSLAIRASSYNDPGLIEAGLQRHAEALTSYSELYDTVLRWSGRRLRPGFTLHDLAAAMAAISEGFGLQNAAGVPHERLRLNESADGPGDHEWSLLAVCAVAVCEQLTEPDPEAQPFDPATLPARWLQGAVPSAGDGGEQVAGVGER
jgi:AcrR family transcriptional regulator